MVYQNKYEAQSYELTDGDSRYILTITFVSSGKEAETRHQQTSFLHPSARRGTVDLAGLIERIMKELEHNSQDHPDIPGSTSAHSAGTSQEPGEHSRTVHSNVVDPESGVCHEGSE